MVHDGDRIPTGVCSTLKGLLMIEKFSPDTVLLPVPNYVAATKVSPESETIYVSGQVGVLKDGSYPSGLAEQTRVALENILLILEHANLTMENIVKLNFFVKAGGDVEELRRARNGLLPDTPVASTIVFVSGLVLDDLLVEIDCIAAS